MSISSKADGFFTFASFNPTPDPSPEKEGGRGTLYVSPPFQGRGRGVGLNERL